MPYWETARELRGMRSLISCDIQRGAQTTSDTLTGHFDSFRKDFERSDQQLASSGIRAQIDPPLMLEHLAAIQSMQSQSIDAQSSLVASVERIRKELGSLVVDRRTLREQGEQLRLMTQSFEEVRQTIRELARTPKDDDMKPDTRLRRVATATLQQSTMSSEAISDLSVTLFWVQSIANHSKVHALSGRPEVLPHAATVRVVLHKTCQ